MSRFKSCSLTLNLKHCVIVDILFFIYSFVKTMKEAKVFPKFVFFLNSLMSSFPCVFCTLDGQQVPLEIYSSLKAGTTVPNSFEHPP